jgi:hypothetical protein
LRLYKYLRANFRNNWPTVLPLIVTAVNNTENSALGGLIPASVNDPVADPLTREKRREVQLKKVRKKVVKKPFKVDDFVYIDFPDEPFMKSFDFMRGMVYKISAIDAKTEPYLYSLKELNNTPLKKKYYAWQLLAATDPAETDFPIEKIVKERKLPGKSKEYLVKWLHYDNSYNEWIPKNRLIK